MTSIERTLIDIVVHPEHSGGPSIVLECYRNAVGKVDIKKLIRVLHEIGHLYPYHQAIGFYMEASGAYSPSEIALLKKIPIHLEFYLDRAMKEKTLCEEWKIWIPAGLI